MQPSHENFGSHTAAKSLAFTSILTFTYFLVELGGAFYTGSLALLADSFHMAGDFLALALAWGANYLARRPSNLVKTYGYHRIEVLAALGNAMALWIVSGMIIANAIKRIQAPPEILAGPMTLIASLGLVINIVCAVVLVKQSKTNLNVRGAYINVVSDAFGSIGAIVGGALMEATGHFIIDPIVSGFICLLIILTSLKLMASSINILLEGVPPHLSIDEISRELLKIKGIEEIHDLHVWSVGSGLDLLTGHLLIAHDQAANAAAIIQEANKLIQQKFGIEHSTLQPEIKGQ